jgi:hypothetical protein
LAITAGVVGAGLIAGGTAAAIRAQRMKTAAKGKQYGGSADAVDSMRTGFAQGVDQGNAGVVAGQDRLREASLDTQNLQKQGLNIANSAGQIQAPILNNGGLSLLNSYVPGQVAEAQTKRVLDQQQQATMGGARAGGALGLRDAINANAYQGVQAAQNLAEQRAQEEQALLGAKVAQGNTQIGMQQDANQVAQAQRAQLLGLGTGVQGQAIGQQIGTATGIGQLGIANQGQQLNALQETNAQQLTADLDYERRRQADAQRKSQNIYGLAQTLIGGGANVLSKAGG